MITREAIQELLRTRDDAVGRALVAITRRQTADEVAAQDTRHQNGRGWQSCHARRGTNMAQFYQRTGFLTARQLAWWRASATPGGRPRIEIYLGQLMLVAQERQAARNS